MQPRGDNTAVTCAVIGRVIVTCATRPPVSPQCCPAGDTPHPGINPCMSPQSNRSSPCWCQAKAAPGDAIPRRCQPQAVPVPGIPAASPWPKASAELTAAAATRGSVCWPCWFWLGVRGRWLAPPRSTWRGQQQPLGYSGIQERATVTRQERG